MALPTAPIYQRNILTFENLALPLELGRRLVLVRHAERVDRCFQRTMGDWIHRMFPSKIDGVYCRPNLNMPRRCPHRGPKKEEYAILDYKSDSPLTAVGEGTAERLGWRIYGSNLKIDTVYVSPSLRCIQTCNRLLQGYAEASGDLNTKRKLPMNVETNLFDFTGFAETQLMAPTFLSTPFLAERHMTINQSYKPSMPSDDLQAAEEIDQFYSRVNRGLEKILKETESQRDSTVLLVTHGPVIDAICLLLLKQPPRTYNIFPKVANYPPYLTTLVMEENLLPSSTMKWRLAPPPIKSFTHMSNVPFDWKKMSR